MGLLFNSAYHRFLGIHWGVPFQNTLNKAYDPQINSYTLARLLKSKKPAIKEAALGSAERRGFNNSVICRAILTGDFSGPIKEKAVSAIAARIKAYVASRPAPANTELDRNDDVSTLENLPIDDVVAVHILWDKVNPSTNPSIVNALQTEQPREFDRYEQRYVSRRLNILYAPDRTELTGWRARFCQRDKAFIIQGLVFAV